MPREWPRGFQEGIDVVESEMARPGTGVPSCSYCETTDHRAHLIEHCPGTWRNLSLGALLGGPNLAVCPVCRAVVTMSPRQTIHEDSDEVVHRLTHFPS